MVPDESIGLSISSGKSKVGILGLGSTRALAIDSQEGEQLRHHRCANR